MWKGVLIQMCILIQRRKHVEKGGEEEEERGARGTGAINKAHMGRDKGQE